MKATELQIGDWVQINEYDEYTQAPYNKPYPVQILNGSDIDRAEEVTFDPIPLTPEILEKNGGVKDLDNNGYIVGNTIGLWVVDDGFEFGHITVRYVHEFQHLLRLCGLNDLADNFKIK